MVPFSVVNSQGDEEVESPLAAALKAALGQSEE